jgi:hypothetical protein
MEDMIAEATAKKINEATKGSVSKEKTVKVVDPIAAAKANWMEPQIVKDLAGISFIFQYSKIYCNVCVNR